MTTHNVLDTSEVIDEKKCKQALYDNEEDKSLLESNNGDTNSSLVSELKNANEQMQCNNMQ